MVILILIFQIKRRKNPYRTTHFKEDLIRFDLASFNKSTNSEKLYKGHYAMLNNKQLDFVIDSLEIKCQDKEKLFSKNITNKYTTSTEVDSIINLNTLPPTEKKATI